MHSTVRTKVAIFAAAVILTTVAIPLTAPDAEAASPPVGDFFATASVTEKTTKTAGGDGDLWPSCWSDDNHLYAAHGDGKGFDKKTKTHFDIGVNRIKGTPAGGLSGETLAHGAAVGKTWTAGGKHNRKPTGMACVNGELYVAVQDLATDFNDAPAASISKSTDKGKTWTFDKKKPMFSGGKFTTIMFLDYGKDYANAPDDFVYAYGLDHNWRDSFDNTVPDPVDLYLARVPKDAVQNRSKWQFYSGKDSKGKPKWTGKIDSRVAVLHDDRRIYKSVFSDNHENITVLGQGGVVYNKPLNRYIYSSWSEYTFEFYESPTPWGPWKRFMSKDFGGYPWTKSKHGGYATTIPSKFISSDGKSMWVQSNVCACGGGGIAVYDFSLRPFTVAKYAKTTASNKVSASTNLAKAAGAVPEVKVSHKGNIGYLRDGNLSKDEGDWNDEKKTTTWWGYTFPKRYHMNKVVYTTGKVYSDGGWFASGLKVQVRQNFKWVDVKGQGITPAYPYSNSAAQKTYTFTFNKIDGDGVRIIGKPGGSQHFTTIAELAVYYA